MSRPRIPRAVATFLAAGLVLSTTACSSGGTGGATEADRAAIDAVLADGGTPIALSLDPSSGVRADMTAAAGGTASLVASDGTTYTLSVAAGGLPADTSVEMTETSGAGVHGVTIEPDGILLDGIAVLEIAPAKGAPTGDALWWDDSGNVRRALATTSSTGTTLVVLSHFSGYGTGTPGAAPAATPVDAWAASTRSFVRESLVNGEISDVDRGILEDGSRSVWDGYLAPLLSRVGKAGCAAESVLLEAMRFSSLAQHLAIDAGDVASNAIMDAAPAAYAAMKKCAEDRCAAGDLGAASAMARSLNLAMSLGVTAAESEAASIIADVYGNNANSKWVRCRVLTLSMGLHSEVTGKLLGAVATTVTSNAHAMGILTPGASGHEGTVGMWLSGTGYDDGTELSGFASLLMGQAPMDGLTQCTATSFPPGALEATVTWGEDDLPVASLVPFVSSLSLRCAKIPPFPVDFNGFLFVALALASNETLPGAIEHAFTPAEAWPGAVAGTGKRVVVSYRWRKEFDIAPLLDSVLPGLYSKAVADLSVRIGLGSTTSPAIAAPATTGLKNGLALG